MGKNVRLPKVRSPQEGQTLLHLPVGRGQHCGQLQIDALAPWLLLLNHPTLLVQVNILK